MKKVIISAVIVIIVVGITFIYLKRQTKSHSPEAKATYTSEQFQISLSYSRPSKKGRDIFGALVPYGKVWRTGANEATEFEINKDVKFNDQVLSAGKYALFSIPDAQQWTIIVNKELGQWGAFTYDQSADVLRTTVPSKILTDTVQMMEINFEELDNGTQMVIRWDLTEVSVPIAPAGK